MSFRLGVAAAVDKIEKTASGRIITSSAEITVPSAPVPTRDYVDSATEHWIDHPIRCGYLLAYCESQYSAENIHFIMEIDRFRDLLSTDKESWGKKNWREIDLTIGITIGELVSNDKKKAVFTGPEDLKLGGEIDWPSIKISREAVVEHVYFIWNKFLSDSAPNQICVPAKVLNNTKQRLEHLHLYGTELFQEALIDPMKTLKRDVLPRFLVSDYHAKLETRSEIVAGNLPSALNFILPSPESSKVLYFPPDQLKLEYLRTVEMYDLLCDYIMYDSFLKYLQSIVSSENLLCARAIEVFRTMWETRTNTTTAPAPPNSKKATPEIEDMAWLVYSYFIAPGAVFEVSVSHKRRKQVMQGLAAPSKQMFYRIDQGVNNALKLHFENYLKSPNFAELPQIIMAEKKRTQKRTWGIF